jgi:predicted secreted Zn-dependent protease
VRAGLAVSGWPRATSSGRCLVAGTAGAYTESMSEPVQDIPVSPAIERAVDLARCGVITHLTIHGERVAAIVPESVIEALRAAEDAEDAAEADAAMDEPGEPVPWEQVKAELDL